MASHPSRTTGPVLFALVVCFVLLCNNSYAVDYQKNIKILTDELATAKNPAAISQIYVSRARNFYNNGDIDKALNDYNKAIEIKNAPWIWMEMGYKCLEANRFEQAKTIAELTKEKFPNFSPKEIARLQSKAESLLTEQQLQENPPEIIYKEEAVKKLNRHDLIKQKKREQALLQEKIKAAREAAEKNYNYPLQPSLNPNEPDILILPDGRRLTRFSGTNYIDPNSGTMYHMEGGLLVNNHTGQKYFIK